MSQQAKRGCRGCGETKYHADDCDLGSLMEVADSERVQAEVPPRIWVDTRFTEQAMQVGGGVYRTNLSEDEQQGMIAFVPESERE